MSWKSEMVLITRYLINDIDGATYSSTRLEQTLVISAQLVNYEIEFPTDYTIRPETIVISPDPTTPTRDDGFINLVCLKTAYIIAHNEAKVTANEAVSVTDGPSRIDLTDRYKALKEMADKLDSQYEQAKTEYLTGNVNPGQAVTGPITMSSIPTIRGNM